jgi:hypothetical protein
MRLRARISRARYYKGDKKLIEEDETALRKTVFAVADAGQLDFDMLCDSVIAHMDRLRKMSRAAVA